MGFEAEVPISGQSRWLSRKCSLPRCSIYESRIVASVLAFQGHRPRGLHNGNSFSHRSGGRKSKLKVPAGVASGEVTVPGVQTPGFLQCPHMTLALCEHFPSFSFSSHKDLDEGLTLLTSFNPLNSLKALSPNGHIGIRGTQFSSRHLLPRSCRGCHLHWSNGRQRVHSLDVGPRYGTCSQCGHSGLTCSGFRRRPHLRPAPLSSRRACAGPALGPALMRVRLKYSLPSTGGGLFYLLPEYQVCIQLT